MKTVNEISKSTEDTFNIAKLLGSKIKPPVLIGINGELGSGKTVFAKGIALGIGVKELVTSPTFLGISEYYSGKHPFIHMDFYKKVPDLKIIESFLQKPAVVFIEWIKNFSSVYSNHLEPDISVYIEYSKDVVGSAHENERKIMIEIKNEASILK